MVIYLICVRFPWSSCWIWNSCMWLILAWVAAPTRKLWLVKLAGFRPMEDMRERVWLIRYCLCMNEWFHMNNGVWTKDVLMICLEFRYSTMAHQAQIDLPVQPTIAFMLCWDVFVLGINSCAKLWPFFVVPTNKWKTRGMNYSGSRAEMGWFHLLRGM